MSVQQRRENLYSKEIVLPDEVLNEVPYKFTYEALTSKNEQQLRKLIFNEHMRNILLQQFERFGTINDKREKKFILKAFVYLDCLITLNRLPTHIEQSPEELSNKFKIPVSIIEHVLTTFTHMSLKNQTKINSQD